jgi:hypothetical protein
MGRTDWRAALAPMLLLIGGLCLLRAQALTWAAADAADGTRYKLSPTVLSHVLQPGRTDSPTAECAIGPIAARTLPRCQLDAAASGFARQLSGTALLVLVSTGLAVGAALLLLWRRPRRLGRVLVATVPGFLALLGACLFQSAALGVLASVGTVNGGFGGIGWYLVHLAPLLAGLAGVLAWPERALASTRPSLAVMAVAGVFALTLLIAPRPLGNSVAMIAAMAGLVAGMLGLGSDVVSRLRRPSIRPAG